MQVQCTQCRVTAWVLSACQRRQEVWERGTVQTDRESVLQALVTKKKFPGRQVEISSAAYGKCGKCATLMAYCRPVVPRLQTPERTLDAGQPEGTQPPLFAGGKARGAGVGRRVCVFILCTNLLDRCHVNFRSGKTIGGRTVRMLSLWVLRV